MATWEEKGIEAVQMFNHILFNKYLAYAKPKDTRKGKLMRLMGVFDKSLRKAFFEFCKNPLIFLGNYIINRNDYATG